MRYSPIAPDFTVFDVAACYSYNAKKHFTIEFHVSDINRLAQVSQPYLKLFLVQKLASRLDIDLNRFTDVTLDRDSGSSSLFMSSTLLDATRGNQRKEISLEAAFVFLHGSIDVSHLAFNLSVPGSFITLTSISLVEHSFRKEFATTTSTVPPTPKIVAPTLVPPKKSTDLTPARLTTTTTTPSTTPVTPPACACPTVSPSCPPCPTCTTPPPCLQTSSSCPPRPTRPSPIPRCCSCPSPPAGLRRTTCPPPTPCPTRRQGRVSTLPGACRCPSSPAPCTGSQAGGGSGISTGALAGGVVAALVLGLALGIIATRLYHVFRGNLDQMTINLIEDNI